MKINYLLVLIALLGLTSCSTNSENKSAAAKDSLQTYVAERLPIYAKVRLTTDIQKLTEN